MKSLSDVKKIITKNKRFLNETYHVSVIGVFGSYAEGTPGIKSDIDILVEFSQPVNFFEFIRLENSLTTLLGVKVDLVTKKALKPLIKDKILNEAVYI